MRSTIAHWVESAYGLEAAHCTALLTRPRNTVVRIEAPEGIHWLRVASGERVQLEDAEAEAIMVTELARRGLRVAAPRKSAAGPYARGCELFGQPSTALLFHEVGGELVATLDAPRAEALGELVGRLHGETLPETYLARARRIDADFLAAAPLERIEPWLQNHGFDIAPLRAMAQEARAQAGSTGAVLCHGDMHADNVAFTGTEPGLFDFETWGLGPPAYDLACFWKKHVYAQAQGEEIWTAFLRGYHASHALRDLSVRELAAWAILRAIWVMALPAAQGAHWGHDWLADREYFETHIGYITKLAQASRVDP